MKGSKLSANTEKIIVALRKAGKPHALIARLLGCHRNSVYRTLKKFAMQLPRRGPRTAALTPEQRAEVLALLPTKGYQSIARELGLRETAVRELSDQQGYRRRKVPISRWRSMPKETRKKIDAEIKQHQNRAVDIAAKYQTTDNVVLKRAHRLLKCPKFRTGLSQPFTSHFPQKTFGKK
jgi:transposase-like protein